MVEKTYKITSKKGLKIAAVVVTAVMVITIVVYILMLRSGINPPNIRVESRDLRTAMEDLDYVAYVDVGVKNYGGPGSCTVYVKVMQEGDYWIKSQSVYLNTGESKSLTFRFPEVGFWELNPISYTVWIEH